VDAVPKGVDRKSVCRMSEDRWKVAVCLVRRVCRRTSPVSTRIKMVGSAAPNWND